MYGIANSILGANPGDTWTEKYLNPSEGGNIDDIHDGTSVINKLLYHNISA